MIKLLLLILLGFVLYSFFLSLTAAAFQLPAQNRRQNRQVTGDVMVEDPVCGTCLPQEDAIKARIKGRTTILFQSVLSVSATVITIPPKILIEGVIHEVFYRYRRSVRNPCRP
jgi:hypothetical protein